MRKFKDLIKRFIALTLAATMILSLSACGSKDTTNEAEELEPITVEREPEPESLKVANEATTIALRQYIYARLATEKFLTLDSSSTTMEEVSDIVDELLVIWENAEQYSLAAEELSSKAEKIFEISISKQESLIGRHKLQLMSLASIPSGLQFYGLAADPKKLGSQIWAENLTKQFDALKGAQLYKQLAQQLGTDAKSAFEQMQLAQSIIHGQATEDAAFWDKMTKAAQATKTASKVGVFVVGTIVTGGGSIAALGTSSMTLGTTAGVIVGGTDCIVDIAATGSNIILGENHQVTVGFDDVKEKLAPVSAVVGLASFNAAETGEQLSYIGDTLTDWFFEGKVMGVKVDGGTVTARIFDSVGVEALRSALETAGYVFPETSEKLEDIMQELGIDPQTIEERMRELDSKMSQLESSENKGEVTENQPPVDEAPKEEEPQVPGAAGFAVGKSSLLGTYSIVSTNKDGGDRVAGSISIGDNGDGNIIWTHLDGRQLILPYDQESRRILGSSQGVNVDVTFDPWDEDVLGVGVSEETVSGTYQMRILSLTKTSD